MVLLGEEAQVKSRFGLFGDSANLDERQVYGFAWNVTCSHKSIWTHPIELLDHVCHLESRFNLFGDSISLGARLVHGLRIMHHRLRNHYGSTR